MTEPTYSQIEAACRAIWPNIQQHSEAERATAKAALMAAQKVDQNVYGHMHHGMSWGDSHILQATKQETMKLVQKWQHESEHTVPALRERVEELTQLVADSRRRVTDGEYMKAAYRQMLGPKGRKVAAMWKKQGLIRVHTSWGPGASALSGEEIAQVHLDMDAAPKEKIDNID